MTNKEIAQKLGISPAALSLIINHKPGVSFFWLQYHSLHGRQTSGTGPAAFLSEYPELSGGHYLCHRNAG